MHQKEGVKFLLSRHNCILADDMGLGKTLQIFALIENEYKKIIESYKKYYESPDKEDTGSKEETETKDPK